MILKLGPLPKIPYVEGIPPDVLTQTRISWILNGEDLTGSSEKYGSSGSLNRTGVAVQKNTVQLENNSTITVFKLNEVIDQVNLITENLEAIADESIAKTLNQAVHDITVLKAEVSQDGTDIAAHAVRLKATEDAIGEYDPVADPKHRTIRNDIIFIKGELGAYTGFNQNGESDPTSEGSGMKYKIMQNANAISIHEGRINKLEDDWVSSDVGQITEEVSRLRTELGSRGQATLDSVYVRLNKQTNALNDTNTEIGLINSYIGRTDGGSTGSIILRMGKAEDNIVALQNTVNNPTTGLVVKVSQIEGDIGDTDIPGSIQASIVDIQRSNMEINLIVGEDSTEGLRGDVTRALSDIGTDSNPTSLKGRVLTLENTSRDTRANLADVTSVVGDANSGLVAANIVLGKEIYGNVEGSDQFEKDGIKKSLQQLIAEVGGSGSGSVQQLITALTARVADLEAKATAQDASIRLLNELQIN